MNLKNFALALLRTLINEEIGIPTIIREAGDVLLKGYGAKEFLALQGEKEGDYSVLGIQMCQCVIRLKRKEGSPIIGEIWRPSTGERFELDRSHVDYLFKRCIMQRSIRNAEASKERDKQYKNFLKSVK